MSQSSRSKVRARRRHREQVARLIADSQLSERVICGLCGGLGFTDDECPCPSHVLRGVEHVHHVEPDCAAVCKLCEGTGSGRRALARALLSDPEQGFDVHAARVLGELMVAMAAEQSRFESAQREFIVALVRGDDPLPRATFKPGAAMGRSTARMGQRLLDAIAGQPSECQRCDGVLPAEWIRKGRCGLCHGTGHNLRGVLPGLVWSAQARRKGWEATRGAGDSDGRERMPLMRMLYEAGREHGWAYMAPHRANPSGEDWTVATRTVPRGEHRDLCMIEAGTRPSTLDERITDRGMLEWTAPERGSRGPTLAPRWRRGELQHAEQRRAAKS